MSLVKSIYDKSPVFLQNLICSIKGYLICKKRYNKSFFKYVNFYEVLLHSSKSEVQEYQKKELCKFANHAYNQSSFWRKRFDDYGVELSKADDIYNQLSKLPILNKEDVKKNLDGITIKATNLSIETVHTSGSTGAGLIFQESIDAENRRWAIWWRFRNLHGINFDTWCGIFGGQVIVPVSQKKAPYWRINNPGKQVLFSAYHLNQHTVRSYFDCIKKKKLPWLHGYPSQLSLLADLIEQYDLGRLPSLKIITTGAENLLDHQKTKIERVFRVKVFQHYGLAESVANISQMRDGSWRLDDEFCYTEFVDTDDVSTKRIVGTNFTNYAFPLFRYDTNDIATVIDGIVQKIDGRQEDYLSLKDGTKIGRLDHIFKDLIYIKESQIYQKSYDEVIFKIVKGQGYDENNEEKRLSAEINQRLRGIDNISIEYLDKIERTRTNKLRFVISDI